MARPALVRAGQGHFHPCTGCNRSPSMQAMGINRGAEVEQAFGVHPHLPCHTVREWHTYFVDIDDQSLPIPSQFAGT